MTGLKVVLACIALVLAGLQVEDGEGCYYSTLNTFWMIVSGLSCFRSHTDTFFFRLCQPSC